MTVDFSAFSHVYFQQKSEAGDMTRSAILTWRLSPSSISAWLLPNPFILFSVAEKMAVAIEHCFGNVLNDEGMCTFEVLKF